MEKTTTARLHRKGDFGAIRLGNGPTVYLDASMLSRLADDLLCLADDIRHNAPLASTFGTRTIPEGLGPTGYTSDRTDLIGGRVEADPEAL